MNHNGALLDEFFREYAHAGEPLVLATVVHTIGSTYRKAGAQMLIAADGRSAGLLSGGCLEADLLERARSVLDAGRALVVDYDSRSSDDILWGMGLGCEGAMRILLSRLDRESGYEPYAFQVRCRERDQHGSIALVIESQDAAYPLGGAYRSDAPADLPAPLHAALAKNVVPDPTAHPAVSTIAIEGAKALVMPVVLPLRLLVLGAGPDAVPLVEIAGLMGWNITVRDHRPAYAVRERFPRARSVNLAPAVSLAEELQRTAYDAAIVMSHHLDSDLHYLRALCGSNEGQKWREQMEALVDAEAPAGERRQRMVASFNRGYRGFQQTYRSCTPAADIAIRRYLDEGSRIARDITARYAN